jgi:DNA modification methylase
MMGASDYGRFLRAKVKLAEQFGFDVAESEVNPVLKPHQNAMVCWMVRMGRAACFAAFGLGKSVIQLEAVRLTLARVGGMGLIVIPLGVRQEFLRDASMLGLRVKFIRRIEETEGPGLYLTNYESVRDGKLDPRRFTVASLDEASVLRGFGGAKTFREFMALFAGDRKTMDARIRGESVPYRFVATATPSPNEFIELLAYAAFLGVMDVGQAKTRYFKRNSEQADKLTLHPHKEREFWLWVASWAIFVQKPSDLGCSDEGYELPEMEIHWHEIPSDHSDAGFDFTGQGLLLKQQALGIVESAREKRESLGKRIAKMMEIRAIDPEAHRILWHDLEAERVAIERAIPDVLSVYGAQDDETKARRIIDFSDGRVRELAGKPVMLGSGCNFQRHCSWAIFLGIGFKFNDLIQSIHRLYRFLQTRRVRIDLIYTESEREVKRILEAKWEKHKETVQKMTDIIREYGLSNAAMAETLHRAMGVERIEVRGRDFRIINNDCVPETAALLENSIDLVLTSAPFSTQYEYSPNYCDFGHSDNNSHFFEQMDFLTPGLLRALKPGRIAAIHVKDRIVPGGLTGLGYQTVYPFHARCIEHYTRHGFGYMGMITIVTDVVRENNQTYRLGWSEVCKDGSKMSCGMPEYLLLFRKQPSDITRSYADDPVTKKKRDYSRARWQTDAHGFWRSGGNRLMTPEELETLDHDVIFRWFRDYHLESIYDYEHHIRIGETLDSSGRLPVTFMLLQPPSWMDDVWTDVARMRTLNMLQQQKGKEQHLCLARGALVLTREGYKPIQDVQVGDLVLTHKGRWRPVQVVKNTGVRPVVTLRAQGVPGLTLTPDHKLWTRPVAKNAWAVAHSRRAAKEAEPCWVEAQDTFGSYINQRTPADITQVRISDSEMWLIGRWIADGHVETRGGYMVSIGRAKLEEFRRMAGEHAGAESDLTAVQIRLIGLSEPARALLEKCGKGAENKEIPPVLFGLPKVFARILLDGYLSGDGHYLVSRNRFMAATVSKKLALGLSMLAQRAYGAVSSVYPGRAPGETIIEGRRVKTKQEWIVCFDVPDTDRKKSLPFLLEDGAWKKVREIEDAGETETWCLRVEEDESFTAEGCIVKNCPLQFDICDRVIERFSNPGDTVYDPFGGIMSVPYRAILKGRRAIACELSPRYFMDGAHYLQAAEREMSMPDLFAASAAEVKVVERADLCAEAA